MNRELSPEEEKEYSFFIKKLLHTVFTISKKDWERFDELSQKNLAHLRNKLRKLEKIGEVFMSFKKSWAKKDLNNLESFEFMF